MGGQKGAMTGGGRTPTWKGSPSKRIRRFSAGFPQVFRRFSAGFPQVFRRLVLLASANVRDDFGPPETGCTPFGVI